MKNTIKKISLLFAVVLMIALFAVSVSAATEGYYTYEVENGEATITEVDNSISGDVIIPSELGGYPVTEIGGWAFFPCENLTSVTIGGSVIYIDEHAFESYSISKIIVAEDNPSFASDANGVLFDKQFKKLIRYPKGNKQTSYTIPEGIVHIGGYAFSSCDGLRNVTIPDSVVTIEAYAFGLCENLKSIVIPKNVAKIDERAFAYSSMEGITVDRNNKYFSADDRGVLFDKNKTKLIQYPCVNKNEAYSIPEGVTEICECAFAGCYNLKSIIMPDSVVTIESHAFDNCSNLKEISIPNSVTSIGPNAFECCYILENVNISDSVTSIGYRAFSACHRLTNVTIPASVKTIGGLAFIDCNIRHIGFSGSEAEWNQIEIDADNKEIKDVEYLHFNYNPDTAVQIITSAPTCTEGGRTAEVCSCGYSIVIDETKALGHDMGDYVVVKEATCTEKGEERADCSRCDYFKTKTTALKKHIDTDGDENCDVCELYLPSLSCLCVCHAKSIGAFLYKLFTMLDNTFGTNLLEKVFNITSEYCDCGLYHY